MRTSLLGRDPEIAAVTLEMLVGIADAIEREAIRRYELLEEIMRRRGEFDTAEAFQTLADEERGHLDSVAQHARTLHVPIPEAREFQWLLPPEIANSWEEIEGSTLLTPYRAFALAVENEQRAFAFYSYLASRAADREVAAEAERLAADELRHAAHLRRWRREAWHRERRERPDAGTAPVPPEIVESPSGLRSYLQQRTGAIARDMRALASRLREIGDTESATLLDAFVDAHRPAAVVPASEGFGATAASRAIDSSDPVHLLVAAQKPLETLVEALESILTLAQDECLAIAESATTDAVAWIARLAQQTERRMAVPPLSGDASGAPELRP